MVVGVVVGRSDDVDTGTSVALAAGWDLVIVIRSSSCSRRGFLLVHVVCQTVVEMVAASPSPSPWSSVVGTVAIATIGRRDVIAVVADCATLCEVATTARRQSTSHPVATPSRVVLLLDLLVQLRRPECTAAVVVHPSCDQCAPRG